MNQASKSWSRASLESSPALESEEVSKQQKNKACQKDTESLGEAQQPKQSSVGNKIVTV